MFVAICNVLTMRSLVLSYSVRFLSPSFSLHASRYLSMYSYSLQYELLSNEPYHWCSGFLLLFSRCAFVASAFVCLFICLHWLSCCNDMEYLFLFWGPPVITLVPKLVLLPKFACKCCRVCSAMQYSGMYWFIHCQCGKLVFYSIIKAWKLMDCLQNGSTLSHQIK